MKTLNRFKVRYRSAKTSETKTKVFNLASLNLSAADFHKFIKWQTNL